MDETSGATLFRRSIRRRWWILVIALLLGAGAGGVLVTSSNTEYRATSVIFLEPLVGNPYSPTTPSGRQEQLAALTTEAGLLLADAVARDVQRAARTAGEDLGPQIQERTSTEVPSNSQVIHVSFTADSPETAQFGAQALATAYLDYRQDRSQEVIEAQLDRIDQEITSLSALVDSASADLEDAQGVDSPGRAADTRILEEQVGIYANQLGQLRIERVSVEGAAATPGEIVSPAPIPRQPEGLPAPVLATAAILALLASGLVVAVTLEHLDTRLRSSDEVERLGLRPVYGPVPVWHPALNGLDAEDSYRQATTSARHGVHAVLGTDGPVPLGVAAGLAHTLAETGLSVTLVLATPVNRGTGSYSGLSDALLREEVPDTTNLYQAREGIRVLGAGRQPQELPRLVQGDQFVALVKDLAHQCDTLVLVGPDAGSATGAAVASVADTTLLVCVAGQTRESDLLHAARVVQHSGGDLSGVLLSERKPARSRRGEPETTPGWAGLAALLAEDPSPSPAPSPSPWSRHDAGDPELALRADTD